MQDIKKRHDLLSAVHILKLAVADIKNGYRFNDQHASEKIAVLEEISRLLEVEVPKLLGT